MNNQNFLTSQQEDFKKKVLSFVAYKMVGNSCAITEGPGSVKSILMYDIAYKLMQDWKNVVIAHSGGLNNGHNTLVSKGWQIVPTKGLVKFWTNDVWDIVDANVYLIDEIQRCYGYIVDTIIDKIAKKGEMHIFS